MFLYDSKMTQGSSEINNDNTGALVSYTPLPPGPKLLPRKGGGGRGGGGRSSGKGGGSGSSKGSPAAAHGASPAFTNSRSTGAFRIFKTGKMTTTATAYSSGGGKPFVLGSDTPFSGRQAGGGTRVCTDFWLASLC